MQAARMYVLSTALLLGLANGHEHVDKLLFRREQLRQRDARTAPAGKFKKKTVELHPEGVSMLDNYVPPSLLSKQKSKGGRPEIMAYEDKECTDEIVKTGWYLPQNVKVNDRECMWVGLRDSEAAEALEDTNSKTSMEWICAESGDTMKLLAHANSSDCSSNPDRRFFMTVNKIDYSSLQKGSCTQVHDEAEDRAVYVKILSPDSIKGWPACMKDWTYIYYGIAAGGVAFVMICVWLYCLRRSYKRREGRKKEQMMLWMAGKGGGKGKGMPPGMKGMPPGMKGMPPGGGKGEEKKEEKKEKKEEKKEKKEKKEDK